MLLIVLFLLLTVSLSSTTHSLPDESRHLLSAKLSFSDPDGSLSSWSSDSEPDPCTNWYGVVCDPSTNSTVVSINLSSANIAGPFPIDFCHLASLSYLSLYNNSVNGTLPRDVSSGCEKLAHLDLAQNLLTGELPGSLADLPELVYLDLSYNNFSGDVPERFGGFRKLEVLSVIDNLFSGEVPALLGNISSLKQLNLSFNPFSPGRVPDEFGNLTNLEILWMEDCNLVGPIPDSLGRLERLTVLDLSINSLTGPIPSSLTNLKSVVQIELYNNSLTGELPRNGWANMPELKLFDASMNRLIGNIPDELCSLPLKSLNLYENDLSGVIPKSLADSPNLFEIRLFRNRFTGELPRDLGKNSPLLWVDVSSNELTGELPPGLCDKRVLEELMVIHNRFSGEIPSGLGECMTLTRVRFGNNALSGDVPEGLWGLPHVDLLELVNNSFTGKIEKMIGEAGNLSSLIISDNKFSGEIPEEIGRLGKLVEFSASGNNLTGSLPETMVNLGQLGKLDLHNNRISGEIPTEIHTWKKLNELNLANNEFSGNIPDEIGNLSGLNYLDLSGNGFSGTIPLGLQNLKLNQLNLSNNRLSGEIPPLYAKGIYKSSFMNNPGLCGDMAGLCDGRKGDKRTNNAWLLRSIFILSGLVFTIGVIWFYFKYQNFKRSKKTNDKSKWTLTSFHKLGFSEYEILDSLDEDNVIGSGSSGKVYKVVLSSGEAVAVKKLWGGSKTVEKGEDNDMEKGEVKDDGFEAEVETLGKIRHKNIVKLWCCCTTKDCKLLVYEYMPNGSLGDLLHSNKSSLLDWPMRFKIAMDSAEGLSYLHHDCAPPIVHRDVKSNNILLDSDFGARVADFGVAKSVDMIGKGSKSMSVIAGSCGYIAPEYAYTLRVNEKSDIYSFGVVILELVTGKRPIDPEFGEKDLVKWVCTTLDQKGIDNVIHPKLDICFKEEICKVLNIGLLCTSPLPINRPSMRRVVKMFQEIGGENYSKIVQKDGRLTPYYYEDASDQGSVA